MSAQFPVYVDPTVHYLSQAGGTGGDDAYVSNAWPAEQTGASVYNGTRWINVAGKFFPDPDYQIFTRYDVSPYNDKKINLAHWWSYGDDALLNPNPARITAALSTAQVPTWSSYVITWYTKPALRPDQKIGQVVKGQWGVFDVTDWVAKWTSRSWDNHGFMVDVNGTHSLISLGAQEDVNVPAFIALDFQDNYPPTQAEPEEPANGSTITTLTPKLTVKTSTDADGDPVQYGWALIDANNNLVHSAPYTVGQTSITVPAGKLQYGQTYRWWVATFDGYDYVDPSQQNVWSFTTQDPGEAGSTPTGLEDYFPYQDFPLGQGTAFANMANGNLTVQDTDLDLPGQGLT